MNGKYLLDTNIVIAVFAQDAQVLQQLSSASEVFVPSIVIGELLFGARKSGRVKENVQRVEEFCEATAVLVCDKETASHYGLAKNRLRLKGKPIPENDIWIASLALQHGLTLITRDAHFQEIDGLSIKQW